jgi:hypothetical protein
VLREKLLVLGDQIRTIDLHPTEPGVLIGLVESNVRRGGCQRLAQQLQLEFAALCRGNMRDMGNL